VTLKSAAAAACVLTLGLVGLATPSYADGAGVTFVSLTPSTISPNGDGVDDGAMGEVQVDPSVTDATATWTILDSGDSPLGEPQTLPLDPSGDTTFVMDPNAAGATHDSLSDGTYQVRVDITGTQDGAPYTGSATGAFSVDVTAPDAHVTFTPGMKTFYPVRGDGYLDQVTVSTGVSGTEAPAASDVEVVAGTGDGAVVDTLMATPISDGGTFTWDGRNTSGSLVAAGTYAFRVNVTDTAGNVTTSQGGAVTVSHKHLVSHTVSTTVTAASTFARNDSGSCSSLRRPGLRGWKQSIGYYSLSKCRATPRSTAGVAAAVHAIQLPKAFTYDQIRLSAYGGPAKRGGHDKALIFYYNNQGKASSTSYTLGSRTGWHTGVTAGARKLVDHRVFVWGTGTSGGFRYDVAKFKIDLAYTALQ
jgi:hypothetical protein